MDASVALARLRQRIGSVPWPARSNLSAKLAFLHERKRVLEQREVDRYRTNRIPHGHEQAIAEWFADLDYLGNEVTWAMLSQ